MTGPLVDARSFRDPSGHVFTPGGEIFRTLTRRTAARIVKAEKVAATGRTLYWFDRS